MGNNNRVSQETSASITPWETAENTEAGMTQNRCVVGLPYECHISDNLFSNRRVGNPGTRSFLYTSSLFLLWEFQNEGLVGELT
jgi:hypothetical protein